MKKYILYIIAFVLGAIIAVSVYRLFVPKPEPEYKEDLQKMELLEAARYKSIDSMQLLMREIRKDSIIILQRHEEIRTTGITDPIADSLRASIIERGRKRFR